MNAFRSALEALDSIAMNAALDELTADELTELEHELNHVDAETGFNQLHRLAARTHGPDDALGIALCIELLVRRCHCDTEARVGDASAYRSFTALLLAAQFDDDPTCHALVFMSLVRTAQLDARSDDGFTVAHVAAAAHNASVLYHLGQLAISPADSKVGRLRSTVASSLLVSPARGSHDCTPLMLAASRGALRCVSVLLDMIARSLKHDGLRQAVAARDADERSALHHALQVPAQAILNESYAVPQECIDCAIALLLRSEGALDVDAKDRFGVSAGDFAPDALYSVLLAMQRDPTFFSERAMTSMKAVISAPDYELGQRLAAETQQLQQQARRGGSCPVINKASSSSQNFGKMRRGEVAHPPRADGDGGDKAKCPFLSKQTAPTGGKCPVTRRNVLLASAIVGGAALLGLFLVRKSRAQ
jgi:hypothetical protein